MGVMTVLWAQFATGTVAWAAIVGITVGVAIAAAAILPWRNSNSEPTGDPGGLENKVFLVATAAEAVLIFGAMVLLWRADATDYIVPVVALIVAAHFFVYRWAQPFSLHIATGVIGVCGSLLAIILLASGALDAYGANTLAGFTLATCTAVYGISLLSLLANSKQTA